MAGPWEKFAVQSPVPLAASKGGPWERFAGDTPEPAPGGSSLGSDLGKGVAQGAADLAVGLPLAFVDAVTQVLPPGGREWLRNNAGFDPARAQHILGEWNQDIEASKSPEYQAGAQDVAEQPDLPGAAIATVMNPRYLAGTLARSGPGVVAAILSGGAAGAGTRAAMLARGAAPEVADVAAGNAAMLAAHGTEGVQAAAQNINQQRANNPTGELKVLPPVLAGAGTAAIGVGAGKVGAKLGLGDFESGIAAQGSLPRRVIKGAIQEGALEEMPQSAQEQAWQNVAEGKPVGESVGQQAGAGLVMGAAMGGPLAVLPPRRPGPLQQAAATVAPPTQVVPTGAMPAPVITPEMGQFTDQPEAAAPAVDSGAEVASLPTSGEISSVPPTVIESATTAAKPARKPKAPKQAPGQTALFTYEPLRQAAEQAKAGWNGLNADQRQRLLKRATSSGSAAHATLDYDALPNGVRDDLARFKLARMAKDGAARGEFIATHAMSNDGTPVRESVDEKGRPIYGEYLDRDGAVRQGVAQAIGADYDQDVPDFSASAPAQGGDQTALKSAQSPVAPNVGGGEQPAQTLPKQVQPPTPLPPFQPPPELPPFKPPPTPARPANSIDEAAHTAATSPQNELPEPTQAQKEAGNYRKGHARAFGLDFSIENPAGSERKGTDSNGKPWAVTMRDHYGYIRGTVGRDKDHLDAFIKTGTSPDHAGPVFVVDQNDPTTGQFDEHKVLFGYPTKGAAKQAYLRNYSRGWKGLGAMTEMPLEDFKHWLASGNTKKPVAKPSSPVMSPNPPAKAPFNPETDLTHVRDVDGQKRLVYRADLDNPAIQKIRISDSSGRRTGFVLRDNLLPDQTAPTPYYADRPVIGVEGKSERDPDTRAFVTALAAKSFQTRHFLKDTHRVEPNPNPGGSGFVLVRNTPNHEKPAKVEATITPSQSLETDLQAATDEYNALVPQWNAAVQSGDQARIRELKPKVETARQKSLALDSKLAGQAIAQGAEKERQARAIEASKAPIGSQARPSEFAPEKGLYWEKTAENEWTGRGDWFNQGKTRSDEELAKGGGYVLTDKANTPPALKPEHKPEAEPEGLGHQPGENIPPSGSTTDTVDAVAPESADIAKARADLKDALADLGQVFLEAGLFSKKMMPTPELDAVKLFPVLTRVMDAAFRLGYHSFKENARFVLAQIRQGFGNPAADALTLDHLQGSYIAMAGQYQGQGADSKRDVVGVESLDELLDREPAPQVTSQPAPQQRAEPVPAPLPTPEPAPSPGSAATASVGIADVPGTFLASHKVQLPLYDTQRHVYVPGEATAHEALTALRQDIKAHEDLRKRVKKCQEASHAS